MPCRKDIARLLLRKGSEIDAQNNYGETALMKAASNDCENIVKLLLQNGANVNIIDAEGNNALMWATGVPKEHTNSIVKLLIQHGADVTHVTYDNQSALTMAEKSNKLNLNYDNSEAVNAIEKELNMRRVLPLAKLAEGTQMNETQMNQSGQKVNERYLLNH